MEKLSVRKARIETLNRYQAAGKAEKSSGAGKTQQTGPVRNTQETDLVSKTLEKLMGRIDRAGQQAREGRRTLHAGEAALAEVGDALDRMEELAQKAAGNGSLDRAVLQSELERLRGEIDRIIQNGVREGLFQDGEDAEGMDALVDALLNGLEAQREGTQSLPSWLLKAMTGPAPSREDLLSALKVAQGASGKALLAALGKLPLDNSAAGYLAGRYLGAVISGGVPVSGKYDPELGPELAARGLEKLLELVSEGVSPDEAVELLTGGLFTSMEDFCAQFTGGTAPGLEAFLTGLLGGEEIQMADLAALLAGGGGGGTDLLLDLLAALDGGESASALPAAGPASDGARAAVFGAEAVQAPLPQSESAQFGTVQAASQDLHTVTLDPESGEMTITGSADVILRGQGQAVPGVSLTGTGTVTLQNMDTALQVQTAQANVVLTGENTLRNVILEDGVVLTLEGRGLTQLSALRVGQSAVLRLTGGAFVLAAESLDGRQVPVVIDGPAALMAAEHVSVQNAQGERLSPLDILWKTMLPGWSSLSSLAVDGKQKQLFLAAEDHPDPLRLWLTRGNENQGYPAHSVVLHGRDQAGNPRVRYVYVRWDQRAKSFQEITMYPNPFTVTGGEAETDWHYEEESQTLHILSTQVTAISGGMGTDGEERLFSGRLAMADGLGKGSLILEGVSCRVSAGRAFSLGRENDVTLVLQSGSENIFESGPGFAGISLGPDTSLTIDRDKGKPEGKLTALGGSGGAGIGRDRGGDRGSCGVISIRGGDVTAIATGGGAGIGGALGAKAGDIRIQGGTVTAKADAGSAAIGAGIQGACGDISITSFARVVKTRGGGPEGDIGGCLFGSCGKLQVSSGADLGGAKLWNREGLSIQVGEATLTMPKFRMSARTLRLDGLDLSTRETAQAALEVLGAGRRWVGRLQGAYGAMYGQLAQSAGGGRYARQFSGVVREEGVADLLLHDARVVLRQDPLAPYRLRGMENAGLLLR